MRGLWVMLGPIVWVGCTPSGGGTGSTGIRQLEIDCAAQQGNALRFDCTVGSPEASEIEVLWEGPDGTVRSVVDPEQTTDHHVTIYGMRASTDYQVTAVLPTGDTASATVTTGALPESLANGFTLAGTPSGPPMLMTLPCTGSRTAVIADTDGEVLWYHELPGTDPMGGGAYHFTPDGTVLMVAGGVIYEVTLAGEQLHAWARGVDYPDVPVHHDVHRGENGLTYALFADAYDDGGTSWVMDGLLVFDDAGLIATWELHDHLTPTDSGVGGGFWGSEFPGAIDYSHGNSVTVDGDGTGWVSLRWLSAGLQIDADPASPDFGAVAWTLVGNADSPVVGDFAISTEVGGDADFIGQHHFHRAADGRFALFDNRELVSARALVLDVDVAGGTAAIQEAWEVGTSCSAQGSAYVLDNGHVLSTCATAALIQEFAPGEADPVWSMRSACNTWTMLPRAIPTTL